jgi:hypothetical protein
VLECDNEEPGLLQYFLRIAETLPLDEPSASFFAVAVHQMFELFRSMSHPPTGSIQGVWAETALLAHARNPELLAEAWHSKTNDLHDFSGLGAQLEVKSTTGDLREHEFSLEQLTRSQMTTAIASLILKSDDCGANVFDLLDILRHRNIAPDLVRRSEIIVGKVLGEEWREASDVRFSIGPSLATLALYAASAIPRVPGPLPPTVRHVRFSADLSNVEVGDVSSNPLVEALEPLTPFPSS